MPLSVSSLTFLYIWLDKPSECMHFLHHLQVAVKMGVEGIVVRAMGW